MYKYIIETYKYFQTCTMSLEKTDDFIFVSVLRVSEAAPKGIYSI